MRPKFVTRLVIASSCAVGALGAGPLSAAQASPVPCHRETAHHTRYDCSFYPAGDGIHGGTVVENSAGHRVGYLNQGTNYIYCQQAGGRVRVGSNYNKYWAFTKANDLKYGWVNAVYAHGGTNNGPFGGGVPNCHGKHGAAPGAAVTVKPTPIRYVALGDSYSAGEGLQPYLAGSATGSDKCDRSTKAWPELVRPALFVGSFHFYACSGAKTSNITTRTQYGPEGRPQAQQPALRSANLVSLTIGGNDIDFSGKLQYCAKHGSCNKSSSFTRSVSSAIAALPGELASAYHAIRSRISSQTTVVVLGYPQLFPEKSAEQHCFRLHGFVISLFDDGEQNYLNHEADVVDGVIAKAAAKAGFYYLSSISTFRGHAQCAAGTPYLNGITGPNGHGLVGSGSFHPNSAGHRAYADLLSTFLVTAPGTRTAAGLPLDPPPSG